MKRGRQFVNRRNVLGTVGSGAVLALAGCVGSDDEADEPEDTGDDSADDTEDEPTELSEPTEFPEGEECTVCNMITEEYPEWNAQLVKADETRVYFCSAGCLSAYSYNPEHFGGENETVENVWVTDYDTGELIDGMDAYYVRVQAPDHIDDIMMMNPTPFESREAAESLIDELNQEYDGAYDVEEDIIRFDDFDRELAMHYRADFLNGDDDGHDHGNDEDADAPEEFDLVDGDGETIDTWMRDHWHTAVSVEEGSSRSLYAEAVEADGETIDVDGEHWEFDARLADGAPEDVISIHGHGDHIHLNGETEGLTEIIFEFSHHGEVALTTEADAMTVDVGEYDDHGHDHDDDDGHDH